MSRRLNLEIPLNWERLVFMKYRREPGTVVLLLVMFLTFCHILSALSLTSLAQTSLVAEPVAEEITVDLHHVGSEISPLLFSVNLENTRYAMWQGLSAERLANRKFSGENVSDDWEGTSWRRGAVGADGVAAHWYGIGGPAAQFAPDPKVALTGKQSQRILVKGPDVTGGIGQPGIPLQGGTNYTARFQLKSDTALTVTAQLTGASGNLVHATRRWQLDQGAWREWAFEFTMPVSDLDAQLEITFSGPGSLWVGSASILPSDHFHGMRRDVIRQLKKIAPPLVRWPGGNFTRDYRWKEGLLACDKRPPIHVAWAPTMPFTDHYDFHEVGIDEYMALCQELGSLPFITTWMGEGGAQEAADWVEYCNGSAVTKWGRRRAERGHPEPYRVKHWMIGNEIYGEWMSHNPYTAERYAEDAKLYAAAMKKADPEITVVGVGLDVPWNQTVVKKAAGSFDMLALPRYVPITKALTGNDGAAEFTRQGRHPREKLLHWLAGERRGLDQLGSQGRQVQLMLAEWNIKHDWFNWPFVNQWHVGPIDAAFAAAQLNMLCRESEQLNMTIAAMFQPVNEGAIAVKPFSAELTAMGQAMALCRVHRGGRLLKIDSKVIDACASLSSAGNRMNITFVNTGTNGDQPIELQVHGRPPTRAEATVLSVGLLEPDAVMNETTQKVEIHDKQTISLTIPRFGIVLLQIDLAKAG